MRFVDVSADSLAIEYNSGVTSLLALVDQVTPMIVRVVGPPTPEIRWGDVILDALGLTGVLLIGSALFGFALGALIVWFKERRPLQSVTGESSTDLQLGLSRPASVEHHPTLQTPSTVR